VDFAEGMLDAIDVTAELESRGVVLARGLLSPIQLSSLWAVIRPESAGGAARHRSGEAYGVRGLLAARPVLKSRLSELMLDEVAARALGRAVFPIDALFLDKHLDANWGVPGHQDVIVPIPPHAERGLVRNYRLRDGLAYGQPEESVLEELVAIRIHFDDASTENGALEVVAGSHARGRLSEAQIRGLPLEAYTPCESRAGDVLVFKPLVLHRSSRSVAPKRRRVLQVLYAPIHGWHHRYSAPVL
jgi:hypothetical protein